MASKAMIFEALLVAQRATGVTLSGGKVYFYVPGSLTVLKTIYTDRDKSSSAANPYTLDANGTAMVYGDGLYDVLITDASNVQKFFWEDVMLLDYLTSGSYEALSGDYASLNAAIAAIGSMPTLLTINTAAFPLTAPAVVPSTLSIHVEYPGSIATGTYALTINGPFTATLAQVFTGTGAVTGLSYVNPIWFADTQAGNQLAFNAVSTEGTLEITTIRTVTSISVPNAITIKGSGGLTQAIGDVDNDVLLLTADGTVVDGITIAGAVTTGNTNFNNKAGINIKDRSNITIQNCTITGKQNGIQMIGTAATPVASINIINNQIRYTGYGIILYPSEGTGVVTANFGVKARVIGNDVRLQAGFSTVFSGAT